jgi:nucleoside-diphosphate-sugar epimerase
MRSRRREQPSAASQYRKEDILTISPMTVLVVGATRSIGRIVVEEALRQGHVVRALVHSAGKVRQIPKQAQVIIGDVTLPDTLRDAVNNVDAIVFTLGANALGKVGAEAVDYGGVRNVLAALSSQEVRIALMTAIGVTDRTGRYNRATEAHDWKRRRRINKKHPGTRCDWNTRMQPVRLLPVGHRVGS